MKIISKKTLVVLAYALGGPSNQQNKVAEEMATGLALCVMAVGVTQASVSDSLGSNPGFVSRRKVTQGKLPNPSLTPFPCL